MSVPADRTQIARLLKELRTIINEAPRELKPVLRRLRDDIKLVGREGALASPQMSSIAGPGGTWQIVRFVDPDNLPWILIRWTSKAPDTFVDWLIAEAGGGRLTTDTYNWRSPLPHDEVWIYLGEVVEG